MNEDEIIIFDPMKDLKELAEEIEKRCAKIGKTMDILLEVNIANEESKGGFSAEEIVPASEKIKDFPQVLSNQQILSSKLYQQYILLCLSANFR